ncbi:GerAB/ArcD/ProY family transporter [Alicyclobacillus sp. ALC3]|uniref:GerAB/ArcD/ProY family transporter n=1 Tax=Alicyclobacillus sp. ALC3 TaxID=2796143 RepID=UPI002379724D|nr:GerAB/ArcD/ProY family transporter [Alicyclobacillus sp. ALC3]WDL98390.1 GerAB/ArcD/ProY family transporter [Alicyclobacillus sp. ALC3]
MKISSSQLFWIIVNCSTLNYVAMNPAFKMAKQDAWIVVTVSGGVTLLITHLIARLSLVFGDRSLVGFSRRVCGKWMGTLIVLPYFFVWFLMVSRDLRDWADYVYVTVLPNTPLWLVTTLMAGIVLYVTLQKGIVSIGRFGEATGLLFLVGMFLPLFLMPQVFDWRNLQPVYADSGWVNILRGSVPVTAYMSEPAMMLLMLTPFLSRPQQTQSRVLWATGTMAVWLVFATTTVLLFLGPQLASMLTLPFVNFIKAVTILDFIQNIDAVGIFIWTFAWTIAIATPLFLMSYGIAELWNVGDWRKVAVGVIVSAVLLVTVTSGIGLLSDTVRRTVFVRWALPANLVGIPLLLAIAGMRKRRDA